MKSRLPAFLSKDKICIICEGDEEYDYLNRLKELRVWNEQYEVFLDNADGLSLIHIPSPRDRQKSRMPSSA